MIQPRLSEEGRKRLVDSNKRRVWTEETLRGMRLARRREALSSATRKKMSESHVGYKHSLRTRKKIGESHAGKKRAPFSEEHCKKISESNKGKVLSLEARINISKGKKGDKNPSWKGGVSLLNARIRRSLEYRIWREKVFKRDDWTCQVCTKRGGVLHADHIKPFAFYPKLRFEISNGRTLCVLCHEKTETYGSKAQIWIKTQNLGNQ